MKLNAVVYFSEEDNRYVAECLEIPQTACDEDRIRAAQGLVRCLEAYSDATLNDVGVFGRVGVRGEDLVSQEVRDILTRAFREARSPDFMQRVGKHTIDFYYER